MTNIRLHTSNIRVHTGNIRVHTGNKVRLEAGTPGIQGKGALTLGKRKRKLTACAPYHRRYEAGNYSMKRI